MTRINSVPSVPSVPLEGTEQPVPLFLPPLGGRNETGVYFIDKPMNLNKLARENAPKGTEGTDEPIRINNLGVRDIDDNRPVPPGFWPGSFGFLPRSLTRDSRHALSGLWHLRRGYLLSFPPTRGESSAPLGAFATSGGASFRKAGSPQCAPGLGLQRIKSPLDGSGETPALSGERVFVPTDSYPSLIPSALLVEGGKASQDRQLSRGPVRRLFGNCPSKARPSTSPLDLPISPLWRLLLVALPTLLPLFSIG